MDPVNAIIAVLVVIGAVVLLIIILKCFCKGILSVVSCCTDCNEQNNELSAHDKSAAGDSAKDLLHSDSSAKHSEAEHSDTHSLECGPLHQPSPLCGPLYDIEEENITGPHTLGKNRKHKKKLFDVNEFPLPDIPVLQPECFHHFYPQDIMNTQYWHYYNSLANYHAPLCFISKASAVGPASRR